jgi:hypothetical protein
VKELTEAVDARRWVFLPYPFHEPRPVEFDPSTRRRRLLFSGAVDERIYPYRHAVRRKIRFSLRFRPRVAILPHPGYTDIGQRRVHSIVGEDYVAHASGFVFMFVEPGRDGLEFLRYGECAAARCVPVGKPPLSFSDDMRAPVLDLSLERFADDFRRVFATDDSELSARSAEYHTAMKKHRDPAVLNRRLDEFLGAA